MHGLEASAKKGGGDSRQNLASKFIREVYARKGKKRLDPDRMNSVKQLTYTLRPLKSGESEEENWRKSCIVAIDTANPKEKD